jgi:hypothetical protein
MNSISNRRQRHFGPGTPQQVDGRDRFHFFETFGQDGEYGRHQCGRVIMQRAVALAAIVHFFRISRF